MPSRPWPRIVRGRTMLTVETVGAAASRQAHSAASLAWPYASTGVGTVDGSTGLDSRDPEHRARRRVHDLAARRRGRLASSSNVGAVDVDGAQQRGSLRQRHLGDVVEHEVDAVDRLVDDVAVADVAEHDLDVVRPVVGDR